jgi:glycosyltransferase involved in cell wall biosynthesis
MAGRRNRLTWRAKPVTDRDKLQEFGSVLNRAPAGLAPCDRVDDETEGWHQESGDREARSCHHPRIPSLCPVETGQIMRLSMSVLVSVYKKRENLELILEAFNQQTDTDFELVVCEDDQDTSISDCVASWHNRAKFVIRHVSQPDEGFQKNKVLNQGIRASRGDFIVFIDGDCVPHPRFIESYRRCAAPGLALHGRRVMLSASISRRMLDRRCANPPSLRNLLLSESRKIECGLYLPWLKNRSRESAIWGCNWGILKTHLLELNGFDEDYVRAGIGEDTDIEWRLLKLGIELRNVKHDCLLYHLHHSQFYSEAEVAINIGLMKAKIARGDIRCLNGLDKTRAVAGISV